MAPETAPDSAARWVLVSSILASSMAFIDGTALSVVMPSVQADLAATGPDVLWVSNGFSLPLAALLLLGGVLGDGFGRKRMFLAGIVVFAAASAACGLASDVSMLIAARVVQGLIALLAAALSGLAALVAALLLEKRHALGEGEP